MRMIRKLSRWIRIGVVLLGALLVGFLPLNAPWTIRTPPTTASGRVPTTIGDVIDDDEKVWFAVKCVPGIPCQYPEVVDLRVIVLTYNRAASLQKLLDSLQELVVDDDDVAAMEIWIDANAVNGTAHAETLAVADGFRWRRGRKRVHVQRRHVGIYGQWIDTWRPSGETGSGAWTTREIALFLEDDLVVSPYAYRWLKAAHRFYDDRPYVVGYTYQCQDMIISRTAKAPTLKETLARLNGSTAYLYTVFNTWGFSPHPHQWRLFQDWFHTVIDNPHFRPYVNEIVQTRWFKSFERQKTSSSMWSMYFIYFSAKNRLYCVFSNLNRWKNCLAVNRKEKGLHFGGKAIKNDQEVTRRLMQTWSPDFVNFSDKVMFIDVTGTVITLPPVGKF